MGEYLDWCREQGVNHAHCPLECHHPQPFVHEGDLYCGVCGVEGRETRMIPCTPETCEDA